jgi:hypothetical protein
MLAKRAGVAKAVLATDTSLEAWDALIREAQMRRKLPKLAQLAAKTDQTDPNLQAVCNLLGARSRAHRNRAMMGSIAATVALSFGLGGWWMGQADGVDMVALATVVTAPAQTVAFADHCGAHSGGEKSDTRQKGTKKHRSSLSGRSVHL